MKDKINIAKDLLKKQGKKKIIMTILPVVAPYLLAIIGGLLVVMMVAAPIMKAVEKIESFGDKVSVFFEKTGNFLTLRGFKIIDPVAIEEREEKIAIELADYYKKYARHGIALEAPLIASSIYYPMYNVYDENTMLALSTSEYVEENEEGYKEYFDYLGRVKKDIKDLARHSVSEYISEYACIPHNTIDAEGNPITVYIRGNLIKTRGPLEFNGNFKSGSICNSASSKMIVYSYQKDPERFDNYLKNTYIDHNGLYDVPQNISGPDLDDWYQQTVYGIHDLAKLYSDILVDKVVYVNSYSAFCSTGVVVTGKDAGVYPLEEYVAGVVSAENNFQDSKDPNNTEAMKAQAIAARTYALSVTNNCQNSIKDSSSHQNFTKSISERARKATNETTGMVLTYNNKIFKSEYDSFNCSALCISGLDCTCEYYKLPHLTTSGNVTGSTTSAVNKHVISVPSDFITNKIGGHGRGMSQWGANYLQTQGKNYKEILKYFYAEGVQIATAGGSENGTDASVTVENGIFIVPRNALSGLPGSRGTGPNGFNIFFWNRLNAFFTAAASAGYRITYTDAWRSYDSQVQCRKEQGDLCATPGKSMHGWGIASDLNYHGNRKAKDWAHDNANAFGLKFNVCNSYPYDCREDWHIEPIERKYR